MADTRGRNIPGMPGYLCFYGIFVVCLLEEKHEL
jgi:hypothetical protein